MIPTRPRNDYGAFEVAGNSTAHPVYDVVGGVAPSTRENSH